MKSGTQVCIPVGREVGKAWGRKGTKFDLEKAGQDRHGETLSRCNKNVQMILRSWLADVHHQGFSSQKAKGSVGNRERFKRRAP